MTFAVPKLLWLLLVPLTLLAWEIARRLRTVDSVHPRILRAHAGARQLQLLDPAAPAPRRQRPRIWLALGLMFAVAALSRPQWGHVEEQIFNQAREILIAVDLSRSMLAEDVKPSRLDRAKLLIQSLLERLEGERVGLVLFSGTAFVQCPLSADYEILREFLPALAPDYLPEGGTNYGGLIDASVEAFASDDAADRFLIVLSDGEATDDDWQSKIDDLKQKGIRVVGLGIGTEEGAIIPDGKEGFVKDERGAVVMSKLGSATLQKLATDTNGVYRDASTWVDLPALLRDSVETGRKGQFQETQRVRLIERFQWALAPALFFLTLSFWREFPVRPRPRELKLAARKRQGPLPPQAGATLAGALLLAAGLMIAHAPAQAAVKVGGNSPPEENAPPMPDPDAPAVEEPTGPDPQVVPLTQVVTRLAGQSQRSAADWAELARVTIDYGEHFLSVKKPFPDGPILDALEAVDLGARLDAKAADWPELKRHLEDILKRREEQDQEPPPDQPPPPPEKKPEDNQGGQQNQNGGDKDQKQDNSQQNPDGQPPNPDDQQKQDQQNKDQQKPDNPTPGQEAFGDMKDQQPPPPPPPSEENMQKVGGNPQKKPDDPSDADPSLALPLQKLEQVRDKDSPAKLYQLMESQDHPPQKPQTKDW